MKDGKQDQEPQPHFAKVWHVAWELGLLQMLSHGNLLACLCMFKHSDFKTGECSPTARLILRETEVWRKGRELREGGYTTVARWQEKIVALGLFKRAGFKIVGETQSGPDRKGKRKHVRVRARLYFRASELEIVRHVEEACRAGLLPVRVAAKLARWKHDRELQLEARGAASVKPEDLVTASEPGEPETGIDWKALVRWAESRR